MDLSQIVQIISKIKKPAIIGISGFGGSSKSTFAKKLAPKINAPIIGVDSFYTSKDILDYELWEIFDFKRLENEVLIPFTLGNSMISFDEYDWEKDKVFESKTVAIDNYLIIEGVGLFRPHLMKYFSYTIWIDCPIEVATNRGKRRDRDEYGIPHDDEWDGIWKKNDLQYFESYLPKDNASIILEYQK